ncbi:MAG: response regulator transcription factor [Actinobacteria bacterium]|nr:response regulator transcription factor [Actinomycetota bacterium]
MARVLIIDDELATLKVLETNLRAHGYEVDTATEGAAGLARAVRQIPDVVVLDLGLPDIDGVEVCKRFRVWTDVPIVVLSAHGSEARKVETLDAGADDFVTKPFGMAELEARLRVALRHGARRAVAEETPVLEVGPLRLDLAQRSAELRGEPVELTAREFDLLAFLARHAGKVVTHRMVLEKVWGPEHGDETHYLRVYANRLRRKLEDDPNRPVLLRTSPGVGYQLVAPENP